MKNDRQSDIFCHLQEKISHLEFKPRKQKKIRIQKTSAHCNRHQPEKCYYSLHDQVHGKFFQITGKEKTIWQAINGKRTVQELIDIYFEKHQIIAEKKVAQFVVDLVDSGFLVKPKQSIYQQLESDTTKKSVIYSLLHSLALVVSKATKIEFSIPYADEMFQWLYQYLGKFLFKKSVLFLIGALSLLGGLVFILLLFFNPISLIQNDKPVFFEVIILYVVAFISVCIHEVSHGVAAKHFHRSINKAGFMLYLGLPFLFVDTSEMWLESKNKRILVSLAGPISELFLGSIAIFVVLLFPETFVSGVAFKYACVAFLLFLFNMNPLVELDGYYIFLEYMEIPSLRKKSFQFIRKELWSHFRSKTALSNTQKLLVSYGTLSFIWSFFMMALAILFWQYHLRWLF